MSPYYVTDDDLTPCVIDGVDYLKTNKDDPNMGELFSPIKKNFVGILFCGNIIYPNSYSAGMM